MGLAAAVLAAYRYDAFGNTLASMGAFVTPVGYRGERFDPVVGQYDLRERLYRPASGRFERVDRFAGQPTVPLSFHKYLYAHADPINRLDPSGLSPIITVSVSISAGENGKANYNSLAAAVGRRAANRILQRKAGHQLRLALMTAVTLLPVASLQMLLLLNLRNENGGLEPSGPGQYRHEACFAAGTPLLTPEGSKPIEQFREGDLVLARDENDPGGRVQAKAVQEVFVHEASVLELRVGGRAIRTTAEHPFWAVGKGWLPASSLAEGDLLLSAEDEQVAVEQVAQTLERVRVYNLRVADFHTYFVGCDKWGFSVWSHNACWYHGTDSSETVSTIGLDRVAWQAQHPEEPDKGFFVSPNVEYAAVSAFDKTAFRNWENKTNNTPVVLVANDAVIRPFLKTTIFTNDPEMPEFGEMYIPVEDFERVPRDAFRRTI